MKIKLLALVIFIVSIVYSQDKKLYNPNDNAHQKIDSCISKAKKENKFILLQIGGNWCIWCIRFENLTQKSDVIKNILMNNFIVYHLNYSKENKNESILASLGFPQRFGFPVFVILNENGERIHTQQSDFLEENNSGYDIKKVENFLNNWSPKALDPKLYK
ncbi:Thioredoxin-like [Apibacter mensalis]|uniref:Thioredoxin-like n=1 Tax=Apibacter mensalis TaxID=1586267 RepID=A0A0X3APL3_9FLAO|nr:thioredoxin family protein [Apibacter mensalis]CVK16304.1 Thioredoxin-like [Apibacter mensalis]